MIRAVSGEEGDERSRLRPAPAPFDGSLLTGSPLSPSPESLGSGGGDRPSLETALPRHSQPQILVGSIGEVSLAGLRVPPPQKEDPLTLVMRLRHEAAALLVEAEGSPAGLDLRKGRELIGSLCSFFRGHRLPETSEVQDATREAWTIAADTLVVFFELTSLRRDARRAFSGYRLSIPEMLASSRRLTPVPRADPMVSVLRIARHITDRSAHVRLALLDTALWITDQSLKAGPIEETVWRRRQRHVVDAYMAFGQAPLREDLASILRDTRPEATDRALLASAALGRFAEIFGAQESCAALHRCIQAVPVDSSRIPEEVYNSLLVRGLASFRGLLLDPNATIGSALSVLPHPNPAFNDRAVKCLIEQTRGAFGVERKELTVPVLRWWKRRRDDAQSEQEGRSLLALKVLSQLDDSVLVPVLLEELTNSGDSRESNGVRIRLCQAGLKRNAHHISSNNLSALRDLMQSESAVLREIGAEVYARVANRLPWNLDCCRSILHGRHGTVSPDLASAAVEALTAVGRRDDAILLRDIYLSPMFPRHVRAAAQRGLRDLGEDVPPMQGCEPDVFF